MCAGACRHRQGDGRRPGASGSGIGKLLREPKARDGLHGAKRDHLADLLVVSGEDVEAERQSRRDHDTSRRSVLAAPAGAEIALWQPKT
jgi:hypothetical protein